MRRADGHAFAEPETRWSFPCAQLCDECGLLRWPDDATTNDPHRRLPPSHEGRCTHCGGTHFIDLQRTAITDALAESEAYERGARPRFALRIAGSLGAVGLASLATLAAADADPYFGGAFGVFGLVSLTLLGKRVRADRSTRRLPRRWSMVLPPPLPVHAIASGPAVAQTTLVAPLSGRPCVAYEVAVRHDERPRAPLGTWALVEQRNVALRIAGARVDANGMHLDLHRELHDPTARQRVQRCLHERGLDPHAADLVIYETIVESDARLSLHAGPDGSLVAAR